MLRQRVINNNNFFDYLFGSLNYYPYICILNNQTMQKEFIPYEQALVLKELLFDEPCFGFWFSDEEMLIIEKSKKSTSENIVQAPTFSQALRWFREKYNLHNGIYPYYDEYEFQIKDFNFRLPTNTPINGGLMSYEEAELECLNKLIEIVKQ